VVHLPRTAEEVAVIHKTVRMFEDLKKIFVKVSDSYRNNNHPLQLLGSP